jgi:ubiquinone/menaquinone biosynthesis C-methylase UbiE
MEDKEIIGALGATEKLFGKDALEFIKSYNRPINCIDLGTGAGSFLSILAHCCKTFGGKVYSVDILDEGSDIIMARNKMKNFGLSDFVEFLKYHDANAQCLYFFKTLVENSKKFDIICIDTEHSYQQTQIELEEYSKFLVSDGSFILHDSSPFCNPPYGVRKAIMEFLGKNLEFVVIKDLEGSIKLGLSAGLIIIKKVK